MREFFEIIAEHWAVSLFLAIVLLLVLDAIFGTIRVFIKRNNER